MNRLRLLYAALSALLLASAACSDVTAPRTTLWEGNLSPTAPATVSGVAAAVSQFGRTLVSIQVRQATEGVSYRWGVYAGTCASPGALQGGAALYPVLAPGPTMTAEAEASLPGEFRSGGQYMAEVLALGEGGSEVRVACGTLLETS